MPFLQNPEVVPVHLIQNNFVKCAKKVQVFYKKCKSTTCNFMQVCCIIMTIFYDRNTK